MRMTLDRLLAEQKQLEDELEGGRHVLAQCKHWLRALPADVTLKLVPTPAGNGGNLAAVEERIEKAEEEIAELIAVPVPTADIRERVRDYVANLARPKIRNMGEHEGLDVHLPDSTIAANPLPTKVTSAKTE